MKTIVALIDLSDASNKILEQTKAVAAAFQSTVYVMHVVPFQPAVATYGAEGLPVMEDPSPELVQGDRQKLDRLVAALTAQGIDARPLQFEGHVSGTLIEETRRLHADLVIMGSHHHSALYNLLVGTVTADILRQATFPVLVVPCDENKQAA